jgi:alpha-tubulin suppressor-like RCC1 family protein
MVHAVHASGRVTRWEHGGTFSEWGIYDAASINGGFVVRRSGYGLSPSWYGVDPALTTVGTHRTIVDLEDAVRGANGGGAHTGSCAVHSDGRVSCWGRQPSGGVILRPQARTDISNAIDVTIGYRHTCVLHGDRTVSCWGDNDVGQLGNGTLVDSATAVPVPGLTNIVEISAGQHHTCARRSDDAILCWGSNGYSQIARLTDFPCRPEVDSWMCPAFSSPTLVLGLP